MSSFESTLKITLKLKEALGMERGHRSSWSRPPDGQGWVRGGVVRGGQLAMAGVGTAEVRSLRRDERLRFGVGSSTSQLKVR